MNFLKLTDIFNCQQIKFYHKYLNNKLPEYFTVIFTRLNNSTYNYSTRNRDNISFERVQHEYAKNELDTAFQIHKIIVPISSNINYIHIALKDYRLI